MIDEDRLIHHLQTKSFGFIGDDAAVLPHINNERYLVSKDLLIEDVHFRIQYFSPENLAHKALHVNLSDLAAMGAEPLYILCGISIPQNLQDYAADFLDHLTAACQKAGIILIGGDTTASMNHLVISITAVGKASENQIKYRNTAKIQDLVCVAGNFGFAHSGFIALEKGDTTETEYTSCFLRPNARIREGIWLGKQAAVTSMMDISDGLYIDLKRLCDASLKGSIIHLDTLQKYLKPGITLKEALEGGEDYGLLFTVSPEFIEKLADTFHKTFGYHLKIIGHITEEKNILFRQGAENVDIQIHPFTHFGER